MKTILVLFLLPHATFGQNKKQIYIYIYTFLEWFQTSVVYGNEVGRGWTYSLSQRLSLSAVVLTTVPQAAVWVARRATSTWIEAGTVEAPLISFWTWRLTCGRGKAQQLSLPANPNPPSERLRRPPGAVGWHSFNSLPVSAPSLPPPQILNTYGISMFWVHHPTN